MGLVNQGFPRGRASSRIILRLSPPAGTGAFPFPIWKQGRNLGPATVAPIYSTQLVNASYAVGASPTVYTVPAGATAVVTNIDMYINNTVASQLSWIQLGSVVLLYRSSPAAGIVNMQWVGKQVLTAGQPIILRNDAAVRLAITAYVLQ
jgi:hypothetical protein